MNYKIAADPIERSVFLMLTVGVVNTVDQMLNVALAVSPNTLYRYELVHNTYHDQEPEKTTSSREYRKQHRLNQWLQHEDQTRCQLLVQRIYSLYLNSAGVITYAIKRLLVEFRRLFSVFHIQSTQIHW